MIQATHDSLEMVLLFVCDVCRRFCDTGLQHAFAKKSIRQKINFLGVETVLLFVCAVCCRFATQGCQHACAIQSTFLGGLGDPFSTMSTPTQLLCINSPFSNPLFFVECPGTSLAGGKLHVHVSTKCCGLQFRTQGVWHIIACQKWDNLCTQSFAPLLPRDTRTHVRACGLWQTLVKIISLKTFFFYEILKISNNIL